MQDLYGKQIQRRKHVLDHADYMDPIRKHEPDYTRSGIHPPCLAHLHNEGGIDDLSVRGVAGLTKKHTHTHTSEWENQNSISLTERAFAVSVGLGSGRLGQPGLLDRSLRVAPCVSCVHAVLHYARTKACSIG